MIKIFEDLQRLSLRMATSDQSTFLVGSHLEWSIVDDQKGQVSVSSGTGQQRGIVSIAVPGVYECRCYARPGYTGPTGSPSCILDLYNETEGASFGGAEITSMPYNRNSTADNVPVMAHIIRIEEPTDIKVRISANNNGHLNNFFNPHTAFLVNKVGPV